MAALRHGRRAGATSALLAIVLLAAAPGALAANPTPGPDGTPAPPTCSERFPDDGPAGVDLRLGCIVSEVTGLYTAGQSAPPPGLSSYAVMLAIVVAAALALAWFAGRLLARRAGQRLAPKLPTEWWVCATCRSVNGAGAGRCYACGRPPAGGPGMRTEDDPVTTQSFGSTRKRG